MSEPFGFTIHRSEYGEHPDWELSLPHQCGAWRIVDDGHPLPTNRTETIAALERFIDEAQWALDVLRNLPDDWRGHIVKASEPGDPFSFTHTPMGKPRGSNVEWLRTGYLTPEAETHGE